MHRSIIHKDVSKDTQFSEICIYFFFNYVNWVGSLNKVYLYKSENTD